jgi:hypothetical protein
MRPLTLSSFGKKKRKQRNAKLLERASLALRLNPPVVGQAGMQFNKEFLIAAIAGFSALNFFR